MRMPDNYNSVNAVHRGDVLKLPAGAYVGIVKNAYEDKTYRGRTCLKLEIDIAEGDFKGYFQKDYDYRKQTWDNDNWSYNATLQLITDGKDNFTTSILKGAICDIEQSNNFNFKAAGYDEKKLIGKLVGVTFKNHQYKTKDGGTNTTTRIDRTYTVEQIRKGEAVVVDGEIENDDNEEMLEHRNISDIDLPF